MNDKAKVQEQQLRRKSTIGDLAFVLCLVTFVAIVVVDVLSNHALEKAQQTIERMVNKANR